MSAAWGRDEGIGVDVHVHRITNLWGWCKTKGPEETRKSLEGWLPKSKWNEINHLLVGFGQTVCLPVGRKCGECKLADRGLCPSAVVGRRIKRETVVKEEEGDGEVVIKRETEVVEEDVKAEDVEEEEEEVVEQPLVKIENAEMETESLQETAIKTEDPDTLLIQPEHRERNRIKTESLPTPSEIIDSVEHPPIKAEEVKQEPGSVDRNIKSENTGSVEIKTERISQTRIKTEDTEAVRIKSEDVEQPPIKIEAVEQVRDIEDIIPQRRERRARRP